MKEEYDRILKIKADELSQIKEQLEDLTGQLNKEREKSRKKLDAKDLEYKSSQVKVENFQKDLANIQKELKQVKARLENAKSREKENLLNYEKTLSKLEKGKWHGCYIKNRNDGSRNKVINFTVQLFTSCVFDALFSMSSLDRERFLYFWGILPLSRGSNNK